MAHFCNVYWDGKKKKETVALSDDQEDMLVKWIKANPIFYDKGKGNFKNKKGDKQVLWAQKAATMGLIPGQLTTWYESNRTRYGKLVKHKSGQFPQRLTDRQEWLIKSFDFLKPHIYRQPTRAASAVSTFLLLKLKKKVK